LQINDNLNKSSLIFYDKNEKTKIELLYLFEQNNLYIEDNFHLKLEKYKKKVSFLKKKRNIQESHNHKIIE
jgi:hypothetical protein